jgi:hypothetical protein
MLGYFVHTPNNAVTLYKFGIIVGASPAKVRFGLYRDNGSALPGTLVASTGAVTLVAGRNEVAATPVTLAANTNYYILAVFESATNVGHDTGASTTWHYKSMIFANPFPTMLNDGNAANMTSMQMAASSINYYILVY